MTTILLNNAVGNVTGDEAIFYSPKHSGQPGVMIMVWGTFSGATVTAQVKAYDGTWLNTATTFTFAGYKNMTLRSGDAIRLVVSGGTAPVLNAELR